MHRLAPLLALLLALLLAATARAAEAPPLLVDSAAAGDFALVNADGPADVNVDAADFPVARIAAGLFAADVGRVTGKAAAVRNDPAALGRRAVLIGTLGKSAAIDALVKAGKLDVSKVRGLWETFAIATVTDPLPNVASALVVAGSDRRGTAFGALEVSEQIGVSPWAWWADVTPIHRDALFLRGGANVVGPPGVKYRGIFINDEDWGLQPWAAKTFEPKFGNIGPKTYEKVFELMLRLKANYLWPAMHPCSVEFASVPENVILADRYGIVMGASHAEPMNRNNVHWTRENRGEWRYDTNRAGVYQYWEEYAKSRGPYEAVWSVGMRGIHDSGMKGPRDMADQVRLLGAVIADQRKLIGEYVNPKIDEVPQAFMPYKEALAQYQAGLKVPGDVTLVWCDDNYGFIRQLSDPQEQRRPGGSGVYYHLSYLGVPKPYLWINTTPPALIWSEMHKALTYGADRIWVLNVGDIKPGEIGTEFWTKYGWNPERYQQNAQTAFLQEWAAREFGAGNASDIAALMNEFYQLAFRRKPELMDTGVFGAVNYGEAQARLNGYRTLVATAESLQPRVPSERRDAYFELVLYPVRVAAKTNEAYLTADLAALAARQGRPAARAYAEQCAAAVAALRADTTTFNDALAGGKWKHMMTETGMARTGEYTNWAAWWFMQWPSPAAESPASRPTLGIAIDGRAVPLLVGQPAAAADHDIDWTPADGRVPPPWKIIGTGKYRAVGVPDGVGNSLDPARATPLTFEFAVKQPGPYHLFAQVAAPTDNDDSFFLRLDGGPWQTWNDIQPTRSLAWREQGVHQLSAGPHTLQLANREDGAAVGAIRLTPRSSPERPGDSPFDAPPDQLPTLAETPGRRTATVRLFNADGSPVTDATVTAAAPWIKVSESAETVGNERAFTVSIDWPAAPADGDLTGTVTVAAGGQTQAMKVVATRAPIDGTFAEIDGAVAMEAEHFTRAAPTDAAAWTVVPHLGRTGDGAVAVLPENAPSVSDVDRLKGRAPSLEYDFTASTAGPAEVSAYCLPTHRPHAGRGVRYAVALDDGPIRLVDFAQTGGRSGEGGAGWLENTRRNISVSASDHRIASPGKHTLKLWMVDPGVVVDKLVIDLGGVRPSELGPPETRRGA